MGIQQEGPATCRRDTGLMSCPTSVFKEILRWLSSFMLLLHASHGGLPPPLKKFFDGVEIFCFSCVLLPGGPPPPQIPQFKFIKIKNLARKTNKLLLYKFRSPYC